MLHLSGSRKLVLRTNIRVKAGTQVFDEELRSIGKIFDVFGPVSNPYVSIEPAIGDVERCVGRSLYVIEEK